MWSPTPLVFPSQLGRDAGRETASLCVRLCMWTRSWKHSLRCPQWVLLLLLMTKIMGYRHKYTYIHTHTHTFSKNQLALHPPNHEHNNDCYNTHRFPLGACEDNTIRRLLESPDLKRLILSSDLPDRIPYSSILLCASDVWAIVLRLILIGFIIKSLC